VCCLAEPNVYQSARIQSDRKKQAMIIKVGNMKWKKKNETISNWKDKQTSDILEKD
jgi:hypothetical protein